MIDSAPSELGTASHVLELPQVRDLATLREHAGKLSVAQTADALLPVIAALAAAHGDRLAHRDLQTAIGVVLYQCLIRQRLTGRSIHAVIAQVTAGEHKMPRELERSIPRALEAIIRRSLHERPEERFDSLRDMGAALLPFASRRAQQSYVAEVGQIIAPVPFRAQQLETAEALAVRRAKRRGDLKLLVGALIAAVPLAVLALRSDEEPAHAGTTALAAEMEPAPEAAPSPTALHDEPVPKDSPQPARDEPAADVRPSASGSSTYLVDLTVEPGSAWIMLDRKAAGRGRLQRALPIDGKAHEIHIGAPGYKPRALRFKDAPPPGSVVLETAAKRAAPSSPRLARVGSTID